MKRIMSACLTSMLLGTTLPAMAQTDPQSQTSQPQSSQSDTSQSQSQSGQSKSGQSQAGNPARVMSESTTVKATVEDINKSQRLVTLKDQDGNTVKLKVGPAARNFDKLQKGDVVTAKFYQSAAVMLAKPGTEPTGAEQMQYVVRPETGEPGGMVVNSIQTTATVEDMNPQTREVTLKDADGKTMKLKVDKSVKNLDQIKKGDQVVARYTEAAAISVEKPQQPQQ